MNRVYFKLHVKHQILAFLKIYLIKAKDQTIYLEKTQDSLWNYRSMPKEFDHPMLRKGEVEDLRFGSLAEAKEAFFNAFDELELHFKENPTAKVKNTVFGWLDRYENYLVLALAGARFQPRNQVPLEQVSA